MDCPHTLFRAELCCINRGRPTTELIDTKLCFFKQLPDNSVSPPRFFLVFLSISVIDTFRICLGTDLLAVRIDLARRMSADHTIHVGRELLPSDLAKNIVVTLGVMPDQSIETSGAESSLQAAILVSTNNKLCPRRKGFT